jgi:hypothetical protein
MIAGFLGMTATAYYYWRRAAYFDSMLTLSERLVMVLAAKVAKLESEISGEPVKNYVALNVSDLINKKD